MAFAQMYGWSLTLDPILWGGSADWIIQEILNPSILIVVPLATLITTVVVVANASQRGERVFFRVLAAALFPFLAVIFLYLYQESFFTTLTSPGFAYETLISALIGFFLPFLRRMSKEDVTAIIAAFCFSATFSVLVFSYAAVRNHSVFVYYYGLAFGLLGHVILFGIGSGKRAVKVSGRDEE
jgi:cellulose synthase/poly-beta-1,6-N-acetylglucosamine synthase-like glycosyltransferase